MIPSTIVTTNHRARIRDVVIIKVSIAATPLTSEMGVEDGRRDADGSGRSAEEIAHVIGQFMQVG